MWKGKDETDRKREEILKAKRKQNLILLVVSVIYVKFFYDYDD